MRISLLARRKFNFVNGRIKKPADTLSQEFDDWEVVDGLILAWILNSVSPQIAKTLLRSQSSHQAWTELEHRYKQENVPQAHEIK